MESIFFIYSQTIPLSKLVPLESPSGTASSSATPPLSADTGSLLHLCRSTPGLATFCKLAFMKPPTRALDASIADSKGNPVSHSGGCLFNELAWGKELVALVVGVQKNRDRGDRERDTGKGGRGDNKKEKDAGSNASSKWTNNTTVHVVLYLASTLAAVNSTGASSDSNEDSASPASSPSPPVNKFEVAQSINESIAERGLAMLSREYTRFLTGLGGSVGGGRGNEARGRRGEHGNFLLTASSSPSLLSSVDGVPAPPHVMATYTRIHAAFSRAYQAHVGVFRYGDPGDSDDEEDGAPRSAGANSSSAGPGAGAAPAGGASKEGAAPAAKPQQGKKK
jgi:hypothetical protein